MKKALKSDVKKPLFSHLFNITILVALDNTK